MNYDSTWQDDAGERLAGTGGYDQDQWRRVAAAISHLAARDEILAGLVHAAGWTPDEMDIATITAVLQRAGGRVILRCPRCKSALEAWQLRDGACPFCWPTHVQVTGQIDTIDPEHHIVAHADCAACGASWEDSGDGARKMDHHADCAYIEALDA